MKDLKKIFAIAAILCMSLTWASCSSSENGEEPTPPVEEKTTGFISLRLNADAPPSTRMDETEEGNPDERAVERIWVLLYSNTGNTDNDVLLYAFDLNATNYSAPSTSNFFGNDVVNGDMMSGNYSPDYPDPTEYTFVSVAREVVVQEYQLVVITNPGSTFEGKLTKFNNNTSDELETTDAFYRLKNLLAVNGGASEITYKDLMNDMNITSGSRGMFMSNANGLVPIAESDIKETGHMAQLNPKAVKIDRAVAKVIVNAKDSPQGVTLTNGGRMMEFKWTVDNVNKHTYLIRKYAPFRGGWMMEEYATSIIANRKEIYATDPNFDVVSESNWENNFKHDYYREGATDTQDGLIAWNEWDDMAMKVVEERWKYVPENTMSYAALQDPSWISYTTQVVARVIIRYPLLYMLEGNDHYYSFNVNYKNGQPEKWIVFAHSQAISWMKNDSFPYPSLRNVLGYVDQNTGMFVGSDMDQSSFFSYWGEGTPKPDENWDLKALYTGEYNGIEDMTYVISDEKEILWFHPNGLNVYRLPIKHFGDSMMMPGEYGEYGVVRNNVYRIWIDSINGPGNPVAGYISADIKINGWYERSQEEDI